jgi:hypothetical protein
MPCPHNNIDCPCTKEGCPRHGLCCACVAHHKAHGTKLPACLRGIDWQKNEKKIAFQVIDSDSFLTYI